MKGKFQKPTYNEYADKWEDAIEVINKFICEILFRIEWKYGNCRAPFVFPPKYEAAEIDGVMNFSCSIKLEFSDDEQLNYSAVNPSLLPQIIIDDLRNRFSFVE